MLTQIINGRILTPQGWMKDGSVLISDNKILEVTNCDLAIVGANLIDAKGMYIVPGGVEIHVHGGGGRDFMEGTEDAFRGAVAAHMQHGTTSIFPTLSSSTIPMIRAAAATTEKLMAEKDSPILGLHLEGHYFNMKMAGGQIPENIKNPDPEEYIPLLEETNCISFRAEWKSMFTAEADVTLWKVRKMRSVVPWLRICNMVRRVFSRLCRLQPSR
ncbi:amidohydrolase family protein [Parabacteroides goldsteinii]|nr:amidohydrolase family protein [Parabacteroides goldsteinii]